MRIGLIVAVIRFPRVGGDRPALVSEYDAKLPVPPRGRG